MINQLKDDSWVNGNISHPFGQGMHLTFHRNTARDAL